MPSASINSPIFPPSSRRWNTEHARLPLAVRAHPTLTAESQRNPTESTGRFAEIQPLERNPAPDFNATKKTEAGRILLREPWRAWSSANSHDPPSRKGAPGFDCHWAWQWSGSLSTMEQQRREVTQHSSASRLNSYPY
ncbi:hypothetical protein BJX68DRAFT_236028 [Aspergillus pseudodeflectus]|uniref:Uncharacterized protein n=1 Tax=Aspergillus pseudodeflectus TaxID=176178 RepID=A0ABR4KIV6_9EURO